MQIRLRFRELMRLQRIVNLIFTRLSALMQLVTVAARATPTLRPTYPTVEHGVDG